MNKRTSFITAGAVTGVLLAGTAAIGANIGILNAADNGNVGNLNAAVAVTAPPETAVIGAEPQVIDIYVEEPEDAAAATTAQSPTTPEATSQEFAVDNAGMVSVTATDSGVLLDAVAVAEGWTWTASQTAEGLEVTFTSADSEYVFAASLADDGTIVARVDEPIVNVVRVPAASVPATVPSNTISSGDRNDDQGEYDDEDDEYDVDEDEDDDDEDDEDDDDDDEDDDEEDEDEEDEGDEAHEGGDDDD